MSKQNYPVSISPGGSHYPVGVGLKTDHYGAIIADTPDLAFFEIHAENYMMDGGPHQRALEAILKNYALSVHGVGMSLGSAGGIDTDHLDRFATLVNRVKPWLVSEHLAWSVNQGTYLNDLLPLPLNRESLSIVADNIKTVQDRIGRQLLVENPSSYLSFSISDMHEADFLMELVERTDCGLLLDINNIYVSAKNMGFDPEDYLGGIDSSCVGEIHLAGHTIKHIEGAEIRIDDHGSLVSDEVWELYQKFITTAGMKPTLIEWDSDIPDFDVLCGQALKARGIAENIIEQKAFA